MASKLVTEAREGCVLRNCSWRSRIRRRKRRSRESEGAHVANSQAPHRNPPIRNPRDPLLVERGEA
eukprot:1025214-Alexandrium_andersonii.AAC.1